MSIPIELGPEGKER